MSVASSASSGQRQGCLGHLLFIRQGETFGLVGESGCGKTTSPVSSRRSSSKGGALLARGEGAPQPAPGPPAHVPGPYASLDPRMRVGSIIREPLRSSGRYRRRAAREGGVLLAEVGLSSEAAERYPHEFSGGQRQRIGLARALASTPSSSWPTSRCRPSTSRSRPDLNLMKDLQGRYGLTYVMISHDLAVCATWPTPSGYVPRQARRVRPAAQVYDRPAHHYTVGLLDAVPTAEVEQARQKAKKGARCEATALCSRPAVGLPLPHALPRAEDLCAEVEPR